MATPRDSLLPPPGTLMHRTPRNPNRILQGPPITTLPPTDFSVAPQGPYRTPQGHPVPSPRTPWETPNPTVQSVPHSPWGEGMAQGTGHSETQGVPQGEGVTRDITG